MTDRITDIWGTRTPYDRDLPWPVRVDSHLSDGVDEADVDRWVDSACVLCSNGCGCEIAVKDGRMVGIRGRATDTINHGRLGPKGLYGSWPDSTRDRLRRPMIRVDGELTETDWDTAMNHIVDRSRRLLADHGPLSHAFYTSGQLFLEEYYTLAMISSAGLGTPHLDGNTRLCTATSAAAMKETFGSDGQPGSYTDLDFCDAVFLFGHNMAETQTVLWSRLLDRLAGASPPKVVAVDPRRTRVAEAALASGGVHLAPMPGTNQALLNGLIREIIVNDRIDRDYIAAHTIGFDELAEVVDSYTPERVASICEVPAEDIRRAAEIFGTSERVLSTVLQGFYQSHQATAASCQVNNLHLLRGMLGRPGCGLLQMNGQPTAQNTRETGANGDLPGFRNWANPQHIAELAALWNVDELRIPHWGPPTHAMQIWRYAEQGSVRLLWISATNPAVSLPDLARVREILRREDLFVIVQDGFRTETAEFADVVLPAALWGEKQGTFTNASRTVHLSDRAVEPPGEARADLDIFLDYARRMNLQDRDGNPLPPWSDAEGAFHGWQECSRGRLCDYTGLSYQRLRENGSGIPWPCTSERPEGSDRLYADGVFPTDPQVCETYGHDLLTGGAVSAEQYRAMQPGGRAFLKAAEYTPPEEVPDEDYPLACTTGRTVYHFHTRTKTGRSAALRRAAPRPWVELAASDAARAGISEGDLVRVESRRGYVCVPARIGRGREGMVFLPFHYGYWDVDNASGGPAGEHDTESAPRAANELTRTMWDPVSKQPLFVISAVRLVRVAPGREPAPAPTTGASAPCDPGIPATRASGDIEVGEALGTAEPPAAPPTPIHTHGVPEPTTPASPTNPRT